MRRILIEIKREKKRIKIQSKLNQVEKNMQITDFSHAIDGTSANIADIEYT